MPPDQKQWPPTGRPKLKVLEPRLSVNNVCKPFHLMETSFPGRSPGVSPMDPDPNEEFVSQTLWAIAPNGNSWRRSHCSGKVARWPRAPNV